MGFCLCCACFVEIKGNVNNKTPPKPLFNFHNKFHSRIEIVLALGLCALCIVYDWILNWIEVTNETKLYSNANIYPDPNIDFVWLSSTKCLKYSVWLLCIYSHYRDLGECYSKQFVFSKYKQCMLENCFWIILFICASIVYNNYQH